MTKQSQFFDNYDPRTLARSDDPETSHQGARHAAAKLGQLQSEALEMVRRNPGKTSLEITRAEGLDDPRTINRRLGELERLGLVLRGEPRKCAQSGRSAATWKAAELAE